MCVKSWTSVEIMVLGCLVMEIREENGTCV